LASTFTPALNLEVPARGDYTNDWDLPANANYSSIDLGVGGITTLNLTTGTVNLTQAQANSMMLNLAGTLTGNVTILYPSSSSGRKVILDNCNHGSTPFTITFRANAGADTRGVFTATGFGVPLPIIVTPSRAMWDYCGVYPGTLAGFPVNFVPNGWLPCDGSLHSTTQFDFLFDILNYSYGGSGASFGVPDYRGYAAVCSDNMGTAAGSAGRFFNFGPNGATGALNVLAGLQAHAHGVNDPTHAHGAFKAPHEHTGVITGFQIGGQFGAAVGWGLTAGATSVAQPGVTVNPAATGISIAVAGSTVATSVVQPSITRNIYIRW
jgi:microcystin-dependent protein